jgi:hypothetical protein
LHAQTFFKLRDPLGNDRWRDTELPGGGRKTAETRNSEKSIDAEQCVDVILAE